MKRYGALSSFDRVRLLVGYLMVQAFVWLLFAGAGVRICLAVLSAAALAVAVQTRRRTAR